MKHSCSSAGAAALAVAVLLFSLPCPADDFQGANSLLKQLNDAKNPVKSAATTVPGTAEDSAAAYVKDLIAFSKSSTSLSPDQAAQQWFDLYVRGTKVQLKGGVQLESASPTRAVFSILPGPASWPALQKLVANHVPDKDDKTVEWPSLRLIVDTLANDETKQWADLAPLMGAQSKRQLYSMDNNGSYTGLGTALSEMSNQPAQVEKFWNDALTGMEKGTTNGSTFSLPDLVTILGADKAGPLLLRALLLPTTPIQDIKGQATNELARKLALANLDKLTRPPWFLTKNLNSSDLYEALRKKFPTDSGYQPFAIYHVISLVIQGHPDEAAKEASSAEMNLRNYELESATAQIAKDGWQAQVYDFLHSYLGLHPDSGLWDFYVEVAAQSGYANDALKFIQDTNARADLSADAHEKIRTVLYKALLAVDKVDEGIAQLQELIKSDKPQTSTPPASGLNATISTISQVLTVVRTGYIRSNPQETAMNRDIELARLGHLLKRPALEKEGLDNALQLVKSFPTDSDGRDFYQYSNAQTSLISYMMETGLYTQAENLLIKSLVDQARGIAGKPNYFANNTRELLLQLARVYYQAGRWADIVTLLQKTPGWGAKDLVEIASEHTNLSRRADPHLDLIAARALSETGRADIALPILNYSLQEDRANDAAYALLLKIGKGDLVAQLDTLYKQDQFEPRPLIWKATLLLQQGKIAEAETACKAAIAVDPSDGESGKGDRMRVYSVMADICEAKKDAKQAEFFRNVVKAIRLSEDADDYYDAGLLTQAVAMYDHALTLFSDAYCIQSRIARQLAELGRTEEAAVHYRKAFELMPVSFGRMESHCFGCERAFKGKAAVDIATQVFTEMMAKDPKKPQIPYLLGYLDMEQNKYPEALANFQKAVELDPDYINAWKHIVEIGENYQLNPDLRDSAVFNLLRLDPAGRHICMSTDLVRQLAKLWDAEEKAVATIPPVPESLFLLDDSSHNSLNSIGSPYTITSFPISGVDAEQQAQFKLQEMGNNLGLRYLNPRKNTSAPINAVMANKVLNGALGFQ